MSKTTSFAGNILKLVLQNIAIADIGNPAGLQPSGVAGNLRISLHSASPAEGGTQSTNECVYTGYTGVDRKPVVRSAVGWTVTGEQGVNAAVIQFDDCTAGSDQAFFAGIGTDATGVGTLLYYAPLGTELGCGVVEAADLVANEVTLPGHTFANDDRVAFFSSPNRAVPAGITEGQVYWVLVTTADTITFSTTQDGSEVDITGVGQAIVYKMTGLAISPGIGPKINAGALTLLEA